MWYGLDSLLNSCSKFPLEFPEFAGGLMWSTDNEVLLLLFQYLYSMASSSIFIPLTVFGMKLNKNRQFPFLVLDFNENSSIVASLNMMEQTFLELWIFSRRCIVGGQEVRRVSCGDVFSIQSCPLILSDMPSPQVRFLLLFFNSSLILLSSLTDHFFPMIGKWGLHFLVPFLPGNFFFVAFTRVSAWVLTIPRLQLFFIRTVYFVSLFLALMLRWRRLLPI